MPSVRGILLAVAGIANLPVARAAVDPDGVPWPDDRAVRTHIASQRQLIHAEHKKRNDWAFRQSLSPTARLADAIVAQMRETEIRTVWTVPGAWNHYDNESFAGEPFAAARPEIGATDLWKVVKKMPKGALLHAHLTAMLPYTIVFQTVLNTPGMMLSAPNDLSTDEKRSLTTITFSHANTTAQKSASIWTADYVPETLVPVTDAADSFPGGRAEFLAFMVRKVTLSAEDSREEELGVDAIWRKFQGIFSTAGSAWDYEPLIRQFLQDLFGSLVDDNIRWVEIRSGAAKGLVHDGDSAPTADPNAWYDLFLEELEAFKGTKKGEGFWGARLIWTVSRGKPRSQIIADMKNALAHKAKYSDLISGYDLVSQEDLGRPLSDLAPELIWFHSQTDALNLTVPYFFHAGETLGDGNATDGNLFDAAMFNTRRIGHGFSLYKHPLLMDMYRDKDIMVEVCLVSNEALRLNGDVLQHPLPALIAHGVPTALSNDDPAIEGQADAGLSYDFYEAIQGFENLGLAGLGALAENSVRYSNFEDQDDVEWIRHIEAGVDGRGIKADYLQAWNEDWESFCMWVVEEFGKQYNATAL